MERRRKLQPTLIDNFISKELIGERNLPQYLPIADPILNEQNSIIIESIQSNYYKLSKLFIKD